MMYAANLTFALAAMMVGAAPNGDIDPAKAKKFIYKSEQRLYPIGINFIYQTTIWTPVECNPPAVGDPKIFVVRYDENKQLQRRFVLSSLHDVPSSTNVTWDCEEGVRIVMPVTQVPVEEAVLSVEFELDKGETARVRAAVKAVRKQCKVDEEKALSDSRLKFQDDGVRQVAEGLLRRRACSDDTERDKFDFVNVKAYTTIIAGDLGFLMFEVQNRTPKPVTIARAEVIDEETDIALPQARLVMPEPRVSSGERSHGVVVFDNPGDARRFALVLFDDGPREMRLGDIEL